MIALLNLIICLLVGWIISGSALPAVTSLIGIVLFYILRLVRFPLNQLLLVPVVLLLITFQVSVFRTGYVEIIYEPLPILFHFSQGFLLWILLSEQLKDSNFEEVGGKVFCAGLVAGVMLFAVAATATLFRFEPFFVKGLAGLPLALTMWREYQRKQSRSLPKMALTILIATPLLGQLGIASKKTSQQLRIWIGKEEGLGYEYEFPHDEVSGDGSAVTSLSGEGGTIDLPRQANITVDDKTRCFIKFHSIEDFLAVTRQPLYVRTSTVAIFQGNDQIAPLSSERWLLDGDDGKVDQLVTLSDPPERRSLEYSVVLPNTVADQIPLIDGTHRIRENEIYHLAEGRYQIAQKPNQKWIRFSAITSPKKKKSGIRPLSAAKSNPVHLELPDTELAKQINSLVSELKSESSGQKSIVRTISEFVQSRCRYSLQYRNPDNLSPVENLLFGEKKGHCELFAASTVLLLRSAGIPSRIAYGYTGGASNRRELAIAFRGNDIHAWAEILDQNGEWQILDTTPGNRGSPRLAQAGKHRKIDWKQASFDVNPNGGNSEESSGAGALLSLLLGSLSGWRLPHFALLVGGGLFLGCLGNWISRKMGWKDISRSHHPIFAVENSLDQVLSRRPPFINAIISLGETAGVAKAPGRTIGEYVKDLHALGIGDSTLSEAADYFYAIRYEEASPDSNLERRFARSIRNFEKSLS